MKNIRKVKRFLTSSRKHNDTKIIFDEFGLTLNKEVHNLFIQGINYARQLHEHGMDFVVSDEKLLFIYKDIYGYITTVEELFILKEIFISQHYNFIWNRDVIVWDIGMNVGYSSLFFSNYPNVISVYGYEPFTSTYECALANIGLNLEIGNKIIPNNLAVGNENTERNFTYIKNHKGSSGVLGITPNIRHKVDENEVEYQKIQQVTASSVLTNIQNQHTNTNIIIKMDCEGSEYDIIPELVENGNLELVLGLIIEWHQRGPTSIANILTKENYFCFSPSSNNQTTGLLYCIKNDILT
ncbi:MAG: FkbM family methyltransferase [Anaerolineaceae bacterium]|nr:FkbM family methyltransferase [Anaerolineaceae bacterium]